MSNVFPNNPHPFLCLSVRYLVQPKIVDEDIKACNGIIQAVDNVILPKDFVIVD
jgi:uncharacterized surface protein with fasciclin (FAS1) repeats